MLGLSSWKKFLSMLSLRCVQDTQVEMLSSWIQDPGEQRREEWSSQEEGGDGPGGRSTLDLAEGASPTSMKMVAIEAFYWGGGRREAQRDRSVCLVAAVK